MIRVLALLAMVVGGNVSGATLAPDESLLGLKVDAGRSVVDLNLHGTVLPTQVFGPALADGEAVVNISSMAASRVISRVAGYSVAKAGVDQYARWMAVELAKQTGWHVRINTVAHRLSVAEQNHDLLLNGDGSLTDRGSDTVSHTPTGQLGELAEVSGPVVFLCSQAARFMAGVVLPVDGGFSAYAGF